MSDINNDAKNSHKSIEVLHKRIPIAYTNYQRRSTSDTTIGIFPTQKKRFHTSFYLLVQKNCTVRIIKLVKLGF